jgi:hypothetical protein
MNPMYTTRPSTLGTLTAIAMATLGLAATAAHAHEVIYTAALNGTSESPPNSSAGTGSATVTLDLDLNTMLVEVNFAGLTGNVTAAHIHSATATPFAGTAPVATPTPTFPSFPSGVQAGTYSQLFDLSLAGSYNPTFVTAHGPLLGDAEAFLLTSFESGTAYLNIHTTAVPGGEIRGFLVPIPEPAGLAATLVAAPLLRRRRR